MDTLKIITLLLSFHSDYITDLRREGISISSRPITFQLKEVGEYPGMYLNDTITVEPDYPKPFLKRLIYHELTHAYFNLPDSDCDCLMYAIDAKLKDSDIPKLASYIKERLESEIESRR